MPPGIETWSADRGAVVPIDELPFLLQANCLTPQGTEKVVNALMNFLNTETACSDPLKFMSHWESLSQAFQKRYENISIAAFTEAQLLERAIFANNFSNVLRTRFELIGSRKDLLRARMAVFEADNLAGILAGKNANVAGDLPTRTRINLVETLRHCFEQTSDLRDLDHALILSATLVIHTSSWKYTKLRIASLASLGASSVERYTAVGRIEDLERAVVALTKALDEAPDNHPELPDVYCLLAAALQQQFERTGLLSFLQSAVTAAQTAHSIQPQNSVCLGALAQCLHMQYRYTGCIGDLHQAIVLYEQALELNRNKRLEVSLAFSAAQVLGCRFQRLGSVPDLDRAIMILEAYHASSNPKHSLAAHLLEALVEMLIARSGMNPCQNDLDRAVFLSEKALSSVLPAAKVKIHFCVAKALFARFEAAGAEEDLNRSIELFKDLIASTPLDFATLPSVLNNFGNTFMARYRKISGSLEDLNQAARFYEEALECSPGNFIDHGGRMSNLARSLHLRFKITKDGQDLYHAVATFEQIITSTAARPMVRVQAAVEVAGLLSSIATSLTEPAKSVGTYLKLAVRLLALASPRSLRRGDQQRLISELSGGHGGIGSWAAFYSIRAGDNPYTALQFLELGRGVMARLQLESRTEVVDLQERDNSLAQRFLLIRDALESESYSPLPSHGIIPASNNSNQRQRLAAEFDNVLHEIRGLEGFETFGLGLPLESLMQLAIAGPIVVFNATDSGAHAFLVKHNEITTVSLPLLDYKMLKTKSQEFRDALRTSRTQRLFRKSQSQLHNVLQWLWDVAVEPVLNELGFISTPSVEPWPHVWWVAGGYLSRLPIHAAGYHSSAAQRTTLDRVISSYSPTIKALYYARKSTAPQPWRAESILFAAMSKTPKKADLPWADTEIKALNEIISDSLNKTLLSSPSKSQIVSQLPQSHIAHFACHGRSSDQDPSASGIFLADCEQAGVLTVEEIVSLRLTKTQLAYLSACETADNPVDNLLEEGIHLSGAFQLAGIPRVIATLWWIKDANSASIATDIYNWMVHDGVLDVSRSAEALHWAVRRLREHTTKPIAGKVEENDPVLWASYIHSGA